MAANTQCIVAMLSAWNTRDAGVLQQVVEGALSSDVEFCDPHYDIRGHAAFIEMVKAFWAKNGDCKISRASGIDTHHDRARYAWAIDWPDGRRFVGFDAVAIDLPSGKVRRIDGFFGPLPNA
jgi:hypothetical protein